ncbi:molybdenum cofactor sulfurase protein [Brettanomyces bruxellensis AWRI1499]|nr:molybdenum cofactor sulfurase protein [Brettanomyces bruxellensis AWRI1499]
MTLSFSLNATHAIKIAASLVQDAAENSFNYYYNINCHTSLIGLRTLAAKYATFDDISSFEPVEDKDGKHPALNFVSWTGQSNFNGQKFPLGWCKELRRRLDHCYTLYDASALSTSDPPDLSDANNSPDFVVMSFYKIFGMPDIGALILRRSTAKKLVEKRRYFGGGTIDALTIEEPFCRRSKQLHQSLEDGTIPIHAILELSVAIDSHYQIFGSFNSIRLHTDEIRKYAIGKLKQLKYGETGRSMLQIYDWPGAKHGPIIAFSLLSPAGDPNWVLWLWQACLGSKYFAKNGNIVQYRRNSKVSRSHK